MFDTWVGFDDRDIKGIDSDKTGFTDTSLELAKEVVGKQYPHCHYVQGFFPDTITDTHKNRKYAIVSLDCDLYQPMKAGLDFFYPLMPKGGLFLLHDYSSLWWAGAKLAVDEFCKSNDEFVILLPDKSGSALLRKSK